MGCETLAREFHEAYERLAPEFGYETRRESAVPWEDVPEANRRLMEATVAHVMATERRASIVKLLEVVLGPINTEEAALAAIEAVCGALGIRPDGVDHQAAHALQPLLYGVEGEEWPRWLGHLPWDVRADYRRVVELARATISGARIDA